MTMKGPLMRALGQMEEPGLTLEETRLALELIFQLVKTTVYWKSENEVQMTQLHLILILLPKNPQPTWSAHHQK